jgi:hypothetical protein
VEILRFEIQAEDIGKQCVQRSADFVDCPWGDVGGVGEWGLLASDEFRGGCHGFPFLLLRIVQGA